jgi:NAD(P)-dependent dehydrogenase (short-subunit alcohol dehydrogenase family)
MLLEKKIAVITGGNSGIGLASAELFVEQGAKVVVLDKSIHNVNNLKNVTAIEIDMRNQENIKSAISTIIQKIGTIDVLFSNAGINPHIGNIEDTLDENWENILQTKVALFLASDLSSYVNGESIIVDGGFTI